MKCCFVRRETIKFGTHIDHAARDQHAPYMGGSLVSFQNTYGPQWPGTYSPGLLLGFGYCASGVAGRGKTCNAHLKPFSWRLHQHGVAD